MRRHFFIIILTTFTTALFGQSDCIILFRYKGIIVEDSPKIHQIGLPTTFFIGGYKKKTDPMAFAVFNLSDSSFDIELGSHLSSEFCRDPEDIVAFVFKRIKEYPIKLFDTPMKSNSRAKPVEVVIPLDSIKFTYETVKDRKEIIIDMGLIKI